MSLVDRLPHRLRGVLLLLAVLAGILLMGRDFRTLEGRVLAALGTAVIVLAWLGLTRARSPRSQGELLNRRRLEAALEQLEFIRTPALLAEVGVLHLRMGQPKRARPLLVEALKGEPDDSAIQYALGQAAAALGDWPAAWEAFSAVYERDPDFDYGFICLAVGRAYLALKEPALALRLADEFLTRQPQHPLGLLLRGRALGGLGRHADAEASLIAAAAGATQAPRWAQLDAQQVVRAAQHELRALGKRGNESQGEADDGTPVS